MRTFDLPMMRVQRPGEAVEMPSSETDPYYGMRDAGGLGQEVPIVEIVDTTILDSSGKSIPGAIFTVGADKDPVKIYDVSSGRLERGYMEVPAWASGRKLIGEVTAPGYESAPLSPFGNRGKKDQKTGEITTTAAFFIPQSKVLYRIGEQKPSAAAPDDGLAKYFRERAVPYIAGVTAAVLTSQYTRKALGYWWSIVPAVAVGTITQMVVGLAWGSLLHSKKI